MQRMLQTSTTTPKSSPKTPVDGLSPSSGAQSWSDDRDGISHHESALLGNRPGRSLASTHSSHGCVRVPNSIFPVVF